MISRAGVVVEPFPNRQPNLPKTRRDVSVMRSENGSDTIQRVKSGTADACTPRIVVKHFLIAASRDAQKSPTKSGRTVRNAKLARADAQYDNNNWERRGCVPTTRHDQRVRPSIAFTNASWPIGVPRILTPCADVCNRGSPPHNRVLIHRRSQLLKLVHSAWEDACFVPHLGLSMVDADPECVNNSIRIAVWIAATRAG